MTGLWKTLLSEVAPSAAREGRGRGRGKPTRVDQKRRLLFAELRMRESRGFFADPSSKKKRSGQDSPQDAVLVWQQVTNMVKRAEAATREDSGTPGTQLGHVLRAMPSDAPAAGGAATAAERPWLERVESALQSLGALELHALYLHGKREDGYEADTVHRLRDELTQVCLRPQWEPVDPCRYEVEHILPKAVAKAGKQCRGKRWPASQRNRFQAWTKSLSPTDACELVDSEGNLTLLTRAERRDVGVSDLAGIKGLLLRASTLCINQLWSHMFPGHRLSDEGWTVAAAQAFARALSEEAAGMPARSLTVSRAPQQGIVAPVPAPGAPRGGDALHHTRGPDHAGAAVRGEPTPHGGRH